MRQGFTLIELLVVVLILGILAAVALPQYNKAIKKSRVSRVLALGKGIQTAMNVYYLDNGKYPNNFGDLLLSIPLGGATDNSGNAITAVPTGTTWFAYNFGKADMQCLRNKKKGHLQLSTLYASGSNCSGTAGIILHFYADHSDDDSGKYAGKIKCTSPTNKEKDICKALGGVPDPTNNQCNGQNTKNCNSFIIQ